MIKLSFCLHRLPHLTREAFHTYWFERHAPLVARHRKILRIQRYVQKHSLTDVVNDGIRATRDSPEMYDGVAELWWDSLDDMAVTGSDPKAAAAGRELLADERKFIDLARSPLFFGNERVIFG